MKTNETGFNGRLFDRTMGVLEHQLDFRSENQRVMSSNLANIDTPGYKPKRLHFDQELQKALAGDTIALKKTNPKHFGPAIQPGKRFETSETNRLDIDWEMTQMMENNLLYEASTRLLSKKFEALKTVIDAGRR
ncbi:MAG: flagellar basal body rod protein FlgB [Desulfobacteraceae bacterium]|nr:MAG: flagellar basal body rod protein FlgB [Desulfobacteraceae bacterium]